MWSKFKQMYHQAEADMERIATNMICIYITIASMNIKYAFKYQS